MKNFCVSVVIPTYKRSTMLRRAIDSILSQTYKNIEIIVVDDNNPDSEWRKKTEAVMSHYLGNDLIKYIKHEKNLNGSAARNTGIKESKGDLVTFLDDDDWYYPKKIEKQVEYLFSHPEHHAVYCGWKRYGNEIPIGEGDMSFSILSGKSIIITNSIMMWKKDAVACGGFDPSFRRHQEAVFLLNYAQIGGTFGRIEDILIEFDMSDRSNTLNPQHNERVIRDLLEKFQSLIDKLEKNKKGSKRNIYCLRFRGIMYDYIINNDLKQALRIYVTMVLKWPFYFNYYLLQDLCSRVIK